MTERTLNLATKSLPPIKEGKYSIEVSQLTNIKDCTLKSSVLDFHVKTDRVSMNPGEVYSVYPPKDSCSSAGNCLPHIVLHRKTLPWENMVCREGIPWLALMVFSEDDNAVPSTMKYSESIIPEDKLLIPVLSGVESVDGEQVCQTVTFPYSLFTDILPVIEDLPFLAHVRGVDLDRKVDDKEVKDNWFSCVIANRYPKDSEDKNARILHTAHLVSLEGLGDYIDNYKKRKQDAPKYERVRMYSLYSWSFQVKSNESFDFYSLASKLKADTLQSGIKVQDKQVDKLLQLGFVPLKHGFREGSTSISWYHSPFVPREPQWKDHVMGMRLSDGLLEYDPGTGMFNISHSAAWQLGKLMALEDKEFCRQLFSWRLEQKSKAIRYQTDKLLTEKLQKLGNTTANYEDTIAIDNIGMIIRTTWKNEIGKLIDILTRSEPANVGEKLVLERQEDMGEELTQEKLLSLYKSMIQKLYKSRK